MRLYSFNKVDHGELECVGKSILSMHIQFYKWNENRTLAVKIINKHWKIFIGENLKKW